MGDRIDVNIPIFCSDSPSFFDFPFFAFLDLSFSGPHSSSAKSSAVTSRGIFAAAFASSVPKLSSKPFLAFFLSFFPFAVVALIADYKYNRWREQSVMQPKSLERRCYQRTISPPKSSSSSTAPSSTARMANDDGGLTVALLLERPSSSDASPASVNGVMLVAIGSPVLSLKQDMQACGKELNRNRKRCTKYHHRSLPSFPCSPYFSVALCCKRVRKI